MATFNTYPALSVQGPADVALQIQRAKGARTSNALREAQLQEVQGKQGRRNRPLTDWERTWNRYLSGIRSPVERVFGTLKRSYGFRRARYVGLTRNRNHAYLLAMAFNMRKMTRLLAAS